jgi:outer membrane protein assembly factor BamB
MAQQQLIHIGISGTVLALDRATGAEVWRQKFKGSEFVNVVLEDGALYAAARGELFCLDPATGTVRWKNALTGLGWGLISIASAPGSQAVLMREKKKREEQDAATTSAGTVG